jgi:hypothetical protein
MPAPVLLRAALLLVSVPGQPCHFSSKGGDVALEAGGHGSSRILVQFTHLSRRARRCYSGRLVGLRYAGDLLPGMVVQNICFAGRLHGRHRPSRALAALCKETRRRTSVVAVVLAALLAILGNVKVASTHLSRRRCYGPKADACTRTGSMSDARGEVAFDPDPEEGRSGFAIVSATSTS